MKWKIAGCLAVTAVAVVTVVVIRSLKKLGDMLNGMVP